MSENEIKPLAWSPTPGIGYQVVRRPDGGMHITFTDISRETLLHWRGFAMKHLLDSDRLTRNLYDLRQVDEIPEHAVRFAIEANNDPSARYIRVAVVVANEAVAQSVREIVALSTSPGGGAEMKLFTDVEVAENWLQRPLNLLS